MAAGDLETCKALIEGAIPKVSPAMQVNLYLGLADLLEQAGEAREAADARAKAARIIDRLEGPSARPGGNG